MRGVSCSRLLFCLALFFAISLAFAQQNPVQPAAPDAGQRVVTVTVLDHDHHPVTALQPENFTLYTDGRQQPISSVVSGDMPACMGLVIDHSGSMRGKQDAIASAMAEFVRAGNPGNQIFVVMFADDPLLQQDFTGDATLVQRAILSVDARGGTSFYDSVIASADHLAEHKGCVKRVLLLVSDGLDNESRKSLEYTVQALAEAGNPLVYAIGLPANSPSSRGKHALEALTAPGGGVAYSLGNYGNMHKIAGRIAEELRSQYSLSYASPPGHSQIKLVARAGSGKALTVRLNVAQEPIVRAKAATPQPISAARPASVAAVPPSPRGPDCISGTVVDEDQNPVARIHVEAMPAFGPNPYAGSPNPYSVTDTQGHFRLAELVKGNYRLYARAEDYTLRQGPIYRNQDRTPVASSESCAEVTVKFLTRFAMLKVHVIDALTHEPIPNSAITLRNSSGEGQSLSRFDREAGIRVPPGIELTVQAWVAGQRHMSDPITLTTPAAGTSQEITVELDQRAPVPRSP